MRTLKPIHVDHVGSFARPQALLDARAKFLGPPSKTEIQGAHSNAQLRAIEDRHVRDIAAFQESIGLQIVTDGEFRRRSFFSDFYLSSLTGFKISFESSLPYRFENDQGETMPMPSVKVIGKVAWQGSVNVAPFQFLQSITSRTAKVTLPGLGVGHVMSDQTIYRDSREYWTDLVAAYQQEIRALADVGCRHVQIDETALPFLCDRDNQQRARSLGLDPEQLIRQYVAATNAALSVRPADMRVMMHMCRGNYDAYWCAKGGYDPIGASAFAELEVDGYLLEYDTPRAGDFQPLRHIPPGRSVLLGLVSTKNKTVEAVTDLVRRIENAAKFVPFEQLGICPQCGFASSDDSRAGFTQDDERRKLELLLEVARKLWGTI